MKVISKVSNTKLIKGLTYEALSFDNTLPSHNTRRFGQKKIHIKNFGWYLIKNFTDTNGNPLPQINYSNPQAPISSYRNFDATQIQKNDIVVCENNKYKYLVKGGKYRVSEVKEQNKWGAQIKLSGYSRWIKFSSWSFRKLNTQETRELALSQIFDKPENFEVEFVRKFEQETNKTKVLIDCLAKSILDPYRHHYNLIDWTVVKSKLQGLKKEDYDQILQMPLSEILNQYENN
jgi:hypothetical protein